MILSNTETQIIKSAFVGDSFELFISLPDSYPVSKRKYPVIYLLDGNMQFAMVTQIARLLNFGSEIPEVIIVGVGYPDSKMQLSLRARDYTPTENDDEIRRWLKKVSPNPEHPIAFRGTGGAGKFLAFLEGELQPYVRDNYKTDPLDSTLAGFSFGGLFGLYALFNKPFLFGKYIIGSPSIYWDNEVAFQLEEVYAGNSSDYEPRIKISISDIEIDDGTYII